MLVVIIPLPVLLIGVGDPIRLVGCCGGLGGDAFIVC